MKKVLITGATGFIGSHLAKRLVKEKYDVYILYKDLKTVWRIQDIVNKVKLYKVDLLERKKLQKLIPKINPNIICHLANIGIYGGMESTSHKVIQVNIIGLINLFEALEKIPYELFINTGSSSEYGMKKTAMKEKDICEPQSVYAISKLAATLYARSYAIQKNKPITTLRLFSPFGPQDDEKRFLNYVISHAIYNKPFYLSNLNGVRDFVFIDDVIDAYIACIKNPKKAMGEIFNIGTGKQTSVKEAVKMILKVTNSQSKVNHSSDNIRNYESPLWIADITKARKILKWKTKTSFTEGVVKTAQWMKEVKRYE